jgi:hypothetical protein
MENEVQQFLKRKTLEPVKVLFNNTSDKRFKSVEFINNEEIICLYDCIYGKTFHTFNIEKNILSEPITKSLYTNLAINNNKDLAFSWPKGKMTIYNKKTQTSVAKVDSFSHSIEAISSNNLLAVTTHHSNILSIINANNNTSQILNKPFTHSEIPAFLFKAMCFNPTGSVLLTVSAGGELEMNTLLLEYWDTKTYQVFNTELLKINYLDIYNITFAPGGIKIIITSKQNCTLYSTPFNVQYESNIENFPYILFTLRQCLDRDNRIIPNDIAKLIAHECLTSFKR